VKAEGAIKNEQYRDTSKIGDTRRRTKTNKTEKIRNKTQITKG